MGLYIDDVPMTKKQMCDHLHLDFNSIPSHRRKVIQMNTRTIDDKGTKRSAKSEGGVPRYSVYVPHLQQEVTIRYATTQKKEKDGVFSYPAPKSLWLIPAEDGTVLINDESEFLFWYLSPKCLHSPFRVPGSYTHYEYQDKNAEATKELEREEKIINAMSIVVGTNCWSASQLKQLAKGMGISGVDDMTDMVVKSHLKKLVHKDPVKFYNQANSREVLFMGKIQEAIDTQILRLETKLGMTRWYLKGEEILPIQFGQDPHTELKNMMAEKWYLYADTINALIEGKSVSTMLNRPENDATFSKEPKAEPQMRASLTPEQYALLKEIKEKDWLEAKMKKIDNYNLDDPKLMASQRKSYEENKHFYEAWKLAQKMEEEEAVEA